MFSHFLGPAVSLAPFRRSQQRRRLYAVWRCGRSGWLSNSLVVAGPRFHRHARPFAFHHRRPALIAYADVSGPVSGEKLFCLVFGRLGCPPESRRWQALRQELLRRALSRSRARRLPRLQFSAQGPTWRSFIISQFGFSGSSKPYYDTRQYWHFDMRTTLREAGFYENLPF